MKKSIALIFVVSALVLAGCCTTHHVSKWEYKVAVAPKLPAIHFGGGTNAPSFQESFQETMQKERELQQSFLNDLGKEGWALVSENEGTFYFKRPIK